MCYVGEFSSNQLHLLRLNNYYEKNTHHRSRRILGSHLCDRFIKEGYFVINGQSHYRRFKNIEHLFKLENFEFYHHDITKFVHVPVI
jgi:hypothetical protein